MKKNFLALSFIFIAGCAGKLQLLSDGNAYLGTYNTADKSMTVNIDGVTYTGNYVFGQTFGITSSQGFATAYSGSRTAYGNATSFGTTTSTSNQGRALMVGTNNKTIRCDIMASGMNGQGICQDSAGKVYDLMATMK